MKKATILVTPRDRYSGIDECINALYEHTPHDLFKLVLLDLGYPTAIRNVMDSMIADRDNAEIIDLGLTIPMAALDQVRRQIDTEYTVLLDNDSRVTAGWLEPLIETANDKNAAIVYPLILEKAGVDAGASLRNHLFTTQLRVIEHQATPYLIEHKTHRRALPNELPTEVTESEAFELHCVMFNTQDLKSIEVPHITIREHLDIGMQLRAAGRKIYVHPQSIVHFDNLGSRANLNDLKYFNLRWNTKITEFSSRLFEQRWGYKFYSEQSIYNWAFRRRLFLVLRWIRLPIGAANIVDRIVFGIKRRLFPIWDPIPNAEEISSSLYESLPGNVVTQIEHRVK